MRWGWDWRRRDDRRPKVTSCHVRLYARRGCHLCQVAWQLLLDRQVRYGYTLDSEDVDTDPALLQRYGDWVPVVTINGKLRFRGGVSPLLFDRLFKHDAEAEA
jgi:hypothetical protein